MIFTPNPGQIPVQINMPYTEMKYPYKIVTFNRRVMVDVDLLKLLKDDKTANLKAKVTENTTIKGTMTIRISANDWYYIHIDHGGVFSFTTNWIKGVEGSNSSRSLEDNLLQLFIPWVSWQFSAADPGGRIKPVAEELELTKPTDRPSAGVTVGTPIPKPSLPKPPRPGDDF